MMLDRLDELPLRRHEIRGNPAGLLARLLERIDALKAERLEPAIESRAREEKAGERGRPARRPARARARRALRRPRPDPRRAGNLDRGDVFLALDCLLAERPDARARSRAASAT